MPYERSELGAKIEVLNEKRRKILSAGRSVEKGLLDQNRNMQSTNAEYGMYKIEEGRIAIELEYRHLAEENRTYALKALGVRKVAMIDNGAKKYGEKF